MYGAGKVNGMSCNVAGHTTACWQIIVTQWRHPFRTGAAATGEDTTRDIEQVFSFLSTQSTPLNSPLHSPRTRRSSHPALQNVVQRWGLLVVDIIQSSRQHQQH